MIAERVYDYAFVGAGLAGLLTAMAIRRHPDLQDKSILLIDPDPKEAADHTWSYWTDSPTPYDHLSFGNYTTASVYGPTGKHHQLELAPYIYRSIRSEDFYAFAKAELSPHYPTSKDLDKAGTDEDVHAAAAPYDHTVTWIREHVDSIRSGGQKFHLLLTASAKYRATHVFDSRFDTKEKKWNTGLLQHFKGIVIRSKKLNLDTSHMVMMDYRLTVPDLTTFTYVLPLAPDRMLVEFTHFDLQIAPDEQYDKYLNEYVSRYYNLDPEDYHVVETESGVIPMVVPKVEKSTPGVTKIGTAGGWVKASSGYSFSMALQHSETIASQLAEGQLPSIMQHSKYRFYDQVLIDILRDHNNEGPAIFERMYSKNKPGALFKFLDEKSSFTDDLRIMSSLFSGRFIQYGIKTLLK